jgi:hypothetical protein
MCERYESKPNSEGLPDQLKHFNMDLIAEKDKGFKTVNIARSA